MATDQLAVKSVWLVILSLVMAHWLHAVRSAVITDIQPWHGTFSIGQQPVKRIADDAL